MEDLVKLIETLVPLIVAVITAILAYVENRRKVAAIAVMTTPTAFPSSGDTKALDQYPVEAWKMSDATKRWITFNETENDQREILTCIEQNEARHATKYRIPFSKGWYEVEFGLIKSSARYEK